MDEIGRPVAALFVFLTKKINPIRNQVAKGGANTAAQVRHLLLMTRGVLDLDGFLTTPSNQRSCAQWWAGAARSVLSGICRIRRG